MGHLESQGEEYSNVSGKSCRCCDASWKSTSAEGIGFEEPGGDGSKDVQDAVQSGFSI